MLSDETIPVIAAIGEHTFRPVGFEDALEPVDLMAAALRAAEDDAGSNILNSLDLVSVIGIVSWLYADPAALLCVRLSITPRHTAKAGMGGEKSTRLVHEAALAIQRGEAQAIAIVGGEAQNTFRKARRAKTRLDWTPRVSVEEAWGDMEDVTLGVGKQARALGITSAAHIYPFFEIATAASQDLTPAQANRQSAALWARYAGLAGTNPYAWSKDSFSSAKIETITPENRMVNFPYPKWMVSNDSVNQAAAIVVTSLAFARRHGIPKENLIYISGGAAANEPKDFIHRHRYDTCPSLNAVLSDVSRQVGDAGTFDLAELYSCFPVVPKAAMEVLLSEGMDADLAPSVTGGLTFFGGPMNNYMTHATCAMVRNLRADAGNTGLLYAQGGVMTKHHALVVSKEPTGEQIPQRYNVQSDADRQRGPSPEVLTTYEGPAVIETYTVQYGRDGASEIAHVIARTPANERILTQVPPEDADTIAHLTDMNRNRVGAEGTVSRSEDQQLQWHA